MLHFTNYQEDANQNNEISFPHTGTGTHHKEHEQGVLARMQGERDSHSMLMACKLV